MAVCCAVVERTLIRVICVVLFINDKIIRCGRYLGGGYLRNDLREIQESLKTIRILLEDAETQKKPLPPWLPLHKLKQISYEAENVIDELTYQILRPKVKTPFNRCIFSLKNVKLRHKAQVAIRIGRLFGSVIPHDDFDRVTDLIVDNYSIIGREADASKIIHLLTRSSHQRLLTVVPILGMAGLGKTALAKFVFHRAMALNLFDVQMWVCVSQKFDDELQILNLILQSLNESSPGLTDKDAILQLLEKELKMKKFLLVLDDVWELVSSEWWDDFITRLLKICAKNGNVVLVTTRSEELASIVQTSSEHRHTLDFLSDDECWFILKERAFRNVPEGIHSNLEALGREIAKKCRGVSLAANVLGGTLGFIRDEGAWLRIRDRNLNARDNEMSLRFILKLSFDHFDSKFFMLKSCFAFCSVFPKGFSIIKEDLIQMWMAEGFIDSCNKVIIFHVLENLSIKSCAKLTDFPMREVWTLIKIEIKDCEELRFLLGDHKSFPSVTRLSIIGCPKLTCLRNWFLSNKFYQEFRVRRCEWLIFIPEGLGMQRSLISLQIYCCKGLSFFSEEILCKLTQLRKLSIGAFSEELDDFHYLNGIEDLTFLEELEIWGSDVFDRKMFALPNQLQCLNGLRSLNVKGFAEMKALPEWLPNLRSLETIYLNYCWDLEHQSTASLIKRVSNLSHVYIYGCRVLEEYKSQLMEFSGVTKTRILFQ